MANPRNQRYCHTVLEKGSEAEFFEELGPKAMVASGVHVKNPKAASAVVRDGEHYEDMLANLQNMKIPFSGEECFGQYVDLDECHNSFLP
ncbi:uncharacterized protein LOC110696377 isoform X2 [Chenopodium quinoa]|uniref:uncharacterized protein LOC110696377 isoform X2 n=1 Tax=Chenopodium quinoa TaxID=63459 RepID=UPI000B798A64|nr:uncharacterized protein LOC110696377 isoform X2 [Chenopodium quinoa]